MDTHLNNKRILIFLAFAIGIPWIGILGYLALVLVLLFNRRAFAGIKEADPDRIRAVVGA